MASGDLTGRQYVGGNRLEEGMSDFGNLGFHQCEGFFFFFCLFIL